MLLYIFQHFASDWRFLNVFNYLSLRALLAALTALMTGFGAGPWVRAKLRAMMPWIAANRLVDRSKN